MFQSVNTWPLSTKSFLVWVQVLDSALAEGADMFDQKVLKLELLATGPEHVQKSMSQPTRDTT